MRRNIRSQTEHQSYVSCLSKTSDYNVWSFYVIVTHQKLIVWSFLRESGGSIPFALGEPKFCNGLPHEVPFSEWLQNVLLQQKYGLGSPLMKKLPLSAQAHDSKIYYFSKNILSCERVSFYPYPPTAFSLGTRTETERKNISHPPMDAQARN